MTNRASALLRTALLTAGMLVASVLPGCANEFKDIRVETTSEPNVSLAGSKSYAWAAAAAFVRDPEQEWTPPDLDLGAEITYLVNRELRSRGFTETTEAPDVLVLYAVGVDTNAASAIADPAQDASTPADPGQAGVMVILASPESADVMWVGSAVADLSKEPPVDLVKRRLDYAITTMFKRFPG